jgi:chorismate mutase
MQTSNETVNKTLQEINKHRAEIDKLDVQIVQLLNNRAQHSLAIRALKPNANMQLFDPEREQEILNKLEVCNAGPLTQIGLACIYETILDVMKNTPAL